MNTSSRKKVQDFPSSSLKQGVIKKINFFFKSYNKRRNKGFLTFRNILWIFSSLCILYTDQQPKSSMKKLSLPLITSLFSLISYAQPAFPLYGRWSITISNTEKVTLSFLQKETGNNSLHEKWGRCIEFRKDGTFIEMAFASCGLDDNRYQYEGKWSYHPQTNIVELSEIKVLQRRPNIYQRYEVLSSGTIRLLSVEKGKISGEILSPWEKVSSLN